MEQRSRPRVVPAALDNVYSLTFAIIVILPDFHCSQTFICGDKDLLLRGSASSKRRERAERGVKEASLWAAGTEPRSLSIRRCPLSTTAVTLL
ncbi:hypothetical protein FQA47_005951 [Oryzias melastigma]|uniref:Uncharacterized protein n=1 Tax=Oryzias melastigma TaxID=30732 RepID=A0A834FS67_ORYME|nr:hypothetical protein FQA47_005951 [Oryzias melastigma]